MIPNIQPDLLTYNERVAPQGMTVGNLYNAAHPWGMPGPLIVMLVQAGAAVTGRGYLCRQEYSILAAGETALAAETSATNSTILLYDSDHGVTAATVPGTEYINGDTTNSGYWLWKADALAATTFAATKFETAEVTRNTATGWHLSPQHPLDSAPANADDYIVFRPGRVQMCDADETDSPVWGLSCVALTADYYGFMVVKGWWEAAGETTADCAMAESFQVGATNGTAEGVAATAGGYNYGGINMYAATGAEIYPVYVTGYAV